MSFLRDPKRLIATLIAGVAGLIALLDFTGGVPSVAPLGRTLVAWAGMLAALALVVGLLNVAFSHLGRVLHRAPDWGYSLVLLVALAAVIVSGTLIGIFYNPATGAVDFIVFPQLIEPPVRDIFNAVYQPLASAFLALLAFFSLSAALRAVRRRTPEALVIVGVALAALLIAGLPQAQALPLLGEVVRWVNNYLVLAGARGLLLGAALGALIAGVRVLLGFDQPYLDR
jgi:hypothetical protein